MKYLYKLKFSHRFAVLLGTVALSFCIYAGWSYKVLQELKVNGPLYNKITLGKDLVADILPPPEYIIESYLMVLKFSTMTDAKLQKDTIETLTRLKQDYDSRREFWLQQEKAGFDTSALEQASGMALSFYDLVFKSLIPAVQKADHDAIHLLMPKIEAAYQAHRLQIDLVVKAASAHLKANETVAAKQVADSSLRSLIFLVLSLGLALGIGYAVVQSVLKQLGIDPIYAAGIAKEIAKGNFNRDIALNPGG